MIKVFAIQPEVFLSELLLQRLEQFGFDQGRILGEVPKSWREEVKRMMAHAKPQTKKALEVRLESVIKNRSLQRLPAQSDASNWVAAAIDLPRNYLDGIVVGERGDISDDRILEVADPFGESEIWRASTNSLSNRDSQSMARQVSVLMRYAYEIKFIDPYFSGENRYLEFVCECLMHRRDWPLKSKLCLEFHFRWKRSSPGDDNEALRLKSRACFDGIVKSTKDAISRLLRTNDTVAWYQWTEKEEANRQRFHERYVLTDLGGVEFGGGLDAGNPSEQTSVNLVSKATSNILNQRFSKNGNEFDLLHMEEMKL